MEVRAAPTLCLLQVNRDCQRRAQVSVDMKGIQQTYQRLSRNYDPQVLMDGRLSSSVCVCASAAEKRDRNEEKRENKLRRERKKKKKEEP